MKPMFMSVVQTVTPDSLNLVLMPRCCSYSTEYGYVIHAAVTILMPEYKLSI